MEQINNTQNPKAALEALFPQPIDCGNGVLVRPFSLATYALLEKIGSYIIFPHKPEQIEVIETLYICTHDPKELFKRFDELQDMAIDWAETIPPYLLNTITDAVMKQISIVRDAMPPSKETDLKKAQMAG